MGVWGFRATRNRLRPPKRRVTFVVAGKWGNVKEEARTRFEIYGQWGCRLPEWLGGVCVMSNWVGGGDAVGWFLMKRI